MLSKTIVQFSLFFLLCLSSISYGQITIDYPKEVTLDCTADLTPSRNNPLLGFPEVTTTCRTGIPTITFLDNKDQLTACGGTTGVLMRFWTATDNCGGFQTLLQRITLIDTIPPEILCMGNIVVECDADLNPAENPELGFPTIIDCSQGDNLTIIYNDKNEGTGVCNNLPEIVRRTWTVIDACDNGSTCEQVIRVGIEPLTVFCELEDLVQDCNGLDGSRFAAESWDLSNVNQLRNCAAAECGGIEVISDFDFGRLSGGCGITGSLEVNYLINDGCGNSKFKSAVFTLRDTTPPEAFCDPINFEVDCAGDATAASRVASWHRDNIATLENCLFDNCGEVTVSSNFDTLNFSINTLNFDCNDSVGFVVNYILTDECGNTLLKPASIKITDNGQPTFENVPRDTSIGPNDNVPSNTPVVTDNCSSNLFTEFEEERIDNTADEGYQIIRTWRATDDCGNVGEVSQRIMVLDPILSLACSSAKAEVVNNQIVITELLAPNEIVKVFAPDKRIVYNCFRNCGEVQTTRTLTDGVYEVSIEFYTGTWELICSSNISVTIGDGGDDGNTGGGDTGGGNNGGGDTDGGGTGNTDPCTSNECEKIPPVLSNIPADVTVNSSSVPAPGQPTATDNCDTDVQISLSESISETVNADNFVLTRTWTATDDCSNSMTGKQVIRVVTQGNTGGGDGGGTGGGDGGNTGGGDGGDTGGGDGGNTGGGDGGSTGDLCADVVVTTGNQSFHFSNMNAANQIVKIFDQDYNVILECNVDCGSEVNFSYETAGTYFADVQLYTDEWEYICEIRKTVVLDNTTGGGDNGGSSGSGDCEAVEVIGTQRSIVFKNINRTNKIIKVFNETYEVIFSCFTDCQEEIIAPISAFGLYRIDIQLYSDEWTFLCEDKREMTISANSPTDECQLVDCGNNSGGNNGSNSNADCADVLIETTNNQIKVSKLNAPNVIVKVFNANFDVIFECFGDCQESISVDNLGAGNYQANINFYDENWGDMCERIEPLTIGGNLISMDAPSLTIMPNSSRSTAKIKSPTTDFGVYPNPATDEVMIDLQAFKGQKIQLKIYNQLSTMLWQQNIQKVSGDVKRINLSDLEKGVYILYLEAEGEMPIAKKLLVNRMF